MRSRPTIEDVAKLARVSSMTVSRILSGKPLHGKVTTEKVLKAAQALGYRPNAFARQLRTRSHTIVGVVFTRTPGPSATVDLFESKVLGALEAELIQNGSPVLLSSVTDAEMQSKSLPDIVRLGFVETLVCIYLENAAYVSFLKNNVRHLIHIGKTSASVVQVDVDNRLGARLAAQHLYELGHRNVVVVRPLEFVPDHIERAEVFTSEFISLCGLDGRVRYVQSSVWTNQHVESAVEEILKPGVPDAIFATNDFLALQILNALKTKGCSIPQQISLMGFDNMELAEFSSPTLTTISIDKYALGQEAARLTLRCMQEENFSPSGQSLLPVSLLKRASTAPKAV